MEKQTFVIDKVYGVEIDPNKYLNEVNALISLKSGLLTLYNSVRPYEINIQNQNVGHKVFFFGYHPNIPQHLFDTLPCFFHWFGISVCNYARLAGFVASIETGKINQSDIQLNPNRAVIKNACDDYIKSVAEIKEVLKWRNKVAAHFALTDPRKDDNISTLEASIIYPVGFEENRFRTGTVVFSKGDSTLNYDSEIPRWSLTEIFDILVNRYWPDVTFNT